SLTAALEYDSRIWVPEYVGGTLTWQPKDVYQAQGGWRLVMNPSGNGATSQNSTNFRCSSDPQQRYMKEYTYFNFTWTGPDGTVRSFPITTYKDAYPGICPDDDTPTGSAYATDNSGYEMFVTNYYDATIYAPDGTLIYGSVEDSNGNVIGTTDTLGRTPVTVSSCGSGQTCYAVPNSQFGGSSGTSTFTVTTESLPVST
ncbi:MAG: hypothetical protein WBP79_15005, partial [Candidatus Acidiferrales bacterium]